MLATHPLAWHHEEIHRRNATFPDNYLQVINLFTLDRIEHIMVNTSPLVLAFLIQSATAFTRGSFGGNARDVASRAELNTELRCPPSITTARRHSMSMPPFLKKLGLKKPGSDKEEEIPSSSSVAVLDGSTEGKVEQEKQKNIDDECVVPEEETETQRLMRQVKESGTAGIVSYALWELAFWFFSVPVCVFGYREVTGHWPDLSNAEDQKKLGAEAFAFVNFARFAVPLRIGLALSTTPWIQENVIDKFKKDKDENCEVAEE